MRRSRSTLIDGDTIDAFGKRIRLVGFDAPELGDHAHCFIERMLAARATSRLRQMVQLSATSTCRSSIARAGRALPGRWPATMGALAVISRSMARTLATC
jgi:endonuclease YncB( thermonuclease family)